jgi:predicted nucleotidyltransferase
VSGSDGVLMGRLELERAFTHLGERLVRRGVVADLFIVGGAAMALAYDAKRVTRDVDAMFVPHGVVLDEARAVADELGLPACMSPARTTQAGGGSSTTLACA